MTEPAVKEAAAAVVAARQAYEAATDRAERARLGPAGKAKQAFQDQMRAEDEYAIALEQLRAAVRGFNLKARQDGRSYIRDVSCH